MPEDTQNLFIHLRMHSAFSLAEGAIKVKEIPDLCKQHAMPAVAITDSANLFGALEFSLTCMKSGIQPIIGCQVNLWLGDLKAHYPMVLLVQNEAGYGNLMHLVSNSFIKQNEELLESGITITDPVITLKELAGKTNGLIALTGGHKGPLGQMLSKQPAKSDGLIGELTSLFPNRLYVEIMRHGPAHERPDEQIKLEPMFLEKALQHNLPIVATNDVFFATEDMYQAHDALLCIAEGRFISEEDRNKVTPHHYFKSSEEMAELFCDLPEAIQNTVNIARRCHFAPKGRKPILPPFPTDTTEEEEVKKQAEAGLNRRLEEEVFKRSTITNKEQTQKDYFDRLHYELGIIERMGFAGYFLIVADFIKCAKS